MNFEHELEDVYDLVKKEMDKIFQYLKFMHTKSYVTNNHQLVDVEWIKTEFPTFIEETYNPTNIQVEKLSKLIVVDYILKRATEKLKSKISRVEDLTKMHDYWMVRVENILFQVSWSWRM